MQCLCQRQATLRQTSRCFSTSTKRAVAILHAPSPEVIADTIPEYPYGPTRLFKRSAKGLYGGKMIGFGNNTSEKYRTRTRRTWLPNVHNKSVFSVALNRFVKLPVTTNVLRTIDKVGGLDEYLLGEKVSRIKELGETGWWLRWALMQTSVVKERFARQREELGLPAQDSTVSQNQRSSLQIEKPTVSEAFDASLQEEVNEDELSLNVSQAETSPEEMSVETAGSLLSRLEANKAELTLRVNPTRYLELRDGRWVPFYTQRQLIKRRLKQLDPTAVLLRFDQSPKYQRNIPEEKRKAHFGKQRSEYQYNLKALANTKLWEKSRGTASLEIPRRRKT